MSDSEEESDDFQYSSSEEEEQDPVFQRIENLFYDAEDFVESNPAKAVGMYGEVVQLETEHGSEVQYRFNALRQLVHLNFRLGNTSDMVTRYEEMLGYHSSPGVTSNDLTQAIQKVLDLLSSSTDHEALARVYNVTLQTLKTANKHRLWLSTLVKQGNFFVASKNWDALAPVVEELHSTCKLPDGSDDTSKGNELMKVYALAIQLAVARNDRDVQKNIYDKLRKSNELGSAVADPTVTAVIAKSFALAQLRERKWDAAKDEFYDAFTNYQEAGSRDARRCLKYYVLCNILAEEEIDPFDSPEAMAYRDDPEVGAMAKLRTAYQTHDIQQFMAVLNNKTNHIADDEVIAPFVPALLRKVRATVILRLVAPYTAVRLDFLATELVVDVEEVEALLVQLVLDRKLDGRIDQLRSVLELRSSSVRSGRGMGGRALEAVERWSQQLENIVPQTQKSLGQFVNHRSAFVPPSSK